MSFSKAILVIYRDSLKLIFKGSSSDYAFDQSTFKNLEIIDPEKFKSQLKEFLTSKNVTHTPVLLLLSDEAVFSKDISRVGDINFQNTINEFFAEVPFDPSNTVTQIYDLDSSFLAVAANKDLIHNISRVMSEIGGKVIGAYPLAILSRRGVDTGNLKFGTSERVLRSEPGLLQKENAKGRNIWPLIVGVVVLLAIVAGTAFLAKSYLDKRQKISGVKAKPDSGMVQEVSESSQSTETEAPAVEPLKRDEIKITVKNGSGVPGLAGKIKASLEKSGFKEVEAANADESNTGNTIVTFSNKISEEDRKEILSVLSGDFKEVDQNELDGGDIDITITTGILTR